MTDKTIEESEELSQTEREREAFYRVCIAEFQQLGYQEQYLASLKDKCAPTATDDTLTPNEES